MCLPAEVHAKAIDFYRTALSDPNFNWSETLEFQTLSAGTLTSTLRKMIAHSLLHSIRHWAQLSTLTRTAGFPAGFPGDFLMSSALD